jgi:hypothetical protein
MADKHTFLGAMLIAGQVFSAMTLGATKHSVTYQIERAWFDPARVYVLYKMSRAEEHYSLRDVHGTILKEESAERLVSYSRSELPDGAAIELGEGKSAESLVYEDADFSVKVVGREATLSGRRMARDVLVCQNRDVASGPIRWRDTLYYCGVFYSSSGNVVKAVPDKVVQSMTAGWSSEEKKSRDFEQFKLVFCLDREGALLVTRLLAVVSPLKLGVWRIDAKDVEWTTLSPAGVGAALFVANGVKAYSPNSIVLRDGMDRWIACQPSGCRLIDEPRASGSYLLVDDQAGEAIALSLPNLTQPRLLVHSMRF